MKCTDLCVLTMTTGLAMIGTCGLLGVLIVLLHLRERRQDYQAKLQEPSCDNTSTQNLFLPPFIKQFLKCLMIDSYL